MKLTTAELNEALMDLVQRGLPHNDRRLMKELALSVWYSDVLPDLTAIPPASRRDIGYVIETLSGFFVLSPERKRQLLGLIEAYRYRPLQCAFIMHESDFARSWNSGLNMPSFVQEILPYQTRHYAYEHFYERGFGGEPHPPRDPNHPDAKKAGSQAGLIATPEDA